MATAIPTEDGVRTDYYPSEVNAEVTTHYGDDALAVTCLHCGGRVVFAILGGRTLKDCCCENREWWIDITISNFVAKDDNQ